MTIRNQYQFIALGLLALVTLCGLFLTTRKIEAAELPQQSGSATANAGRAMEPPLACNMKALDATQRQRVLALVKQLHASQQGVKELPDGYAIQLPAEAARIQESAEYIALERLCCPFFDFELTAEREGGPVWLKLAGRKGVKEFAKLEFSIREANLTEVPHPVKDSPLVCNDSALNAAQLNRLAVLLTEFRAAKQEARELPDGYAIRLPQEPSPIHNVAEYMTLVRLRSPYFEASLEVEHEGGPVWLKLTGRKGVKEHAKREIGF